MSHAWRPQKGTQVEAIGASWCEELFFGGARGGGKTSFLLGDFIQDVNIYKQHWKGILFRKTYPELEEVIFQSKQIYPKMGAVYKSGDKTWHFPSGSTQKLRSMEREQDADKYQGHEYTHIAFDELPNWKTDVPYNKLKACLRSTADVPHKRIRGTGNPGGVGHSWVKNRFIDPFPDGFKPIDEKRWINIFTGEISNEEAEGKNWTSITSTRMFIPSKITDNKILMENDPGYITRLAQTGSAELVKAWLAGDWNAIEGAYFDTFKLDKHVIDWFEIPKHWYRIRSFDWGYAKPFSVHWWAVSDGCVVNMYDGTSRIFPKGAIICYREWYGQVENKPNVGVRLDNKEIAKGILKLEVEEIHDMVADPAIFISNGGESIAEQLSDQGVYFREADNKRIPGWQQMRYRLNNDLIFIFKGCKHLIRTIPIMQHDKTHFEDLDTDLEDHAVDDTRYACMSRPVSIPRAKVSKPRTTILGKDLIKDLINGNKN
jgi:hypothetical protein